MTLFDVGLWLLLTPILVMFLRRVFWFLDESAQYLVELKQLRDLGLSELAGQPVSKWVRQLRYNPAAVSRYRGLRGS